jgi:hypothetical protein
VLQPALKLSKDTILLLLLLLLAVSAAAPGVLLNIHPMPFAPLPTAPLAVGVPHTLPAAAAPPEAEASSIFSSSSFSQLCRTASIALSIPTVMAGCTTAAPDPDPDPAAAAFAPRADASLLLLLLAVLLMATLVAPAAAPALAAAEPAAGLAMPAVLPAATSCFMLLDAPCPALLPLLLLLVPPAMDGKLLLL